MEIAEAMQYAGRETQIIRARKNLLYTFGATRLPYICLSEKKDQANTILLRKGQITADRPTIAFPGYDFTIEGFDLKPEEMETVKVILSRRVEIQPTTLTHNPESPQILAGPIESAIERIVQALDEANDIRTAVIRAPDEVWNLSLLLYAGTQILRSAPSNISEHLDHLRHRMNLF